MRETLVTDNLSWARKIGCHAARRVPTRVSRDDLAQEATLGLMEAARRFDASLGVSFRTFAGRHVKGRVLDYLRKLQRLDCPVGTLRGGAGVRRRELVVFSDMGTNRFDMAGPDPFEVVELGDQIDSLSGRLESRYRQFLALRREGLSFREIGSRLGVCESRAYMVFQEIIVLIRQLVRQETE